MIASARPLLAQWGSHERGPTRAETSPMPVQNPGWENINDPIVYSFSFKKTGYRACQPTTPVENFSADGRASATFDIYTSWPNRFQALSDFVGWTERRFWPPADELGPGDVPTAYWHRDVPY